LHTLQLAVARLGGQTLFQPPPVPQATVRKIALVHSALVFDARRGVYYASVPGSVAVNGNRIATIDASSGVVSYSAPVGSDPAALALAVDGSSLYVGLNGSGDVVRLGLPGLNEISRTRLPVGGLGQFYAESMSVSPKDPGVVAVSLYYSNITPRHGGVALIRSGVLQPVRTQDHTGSNIVSFDANGQSVYGFDNEDYLAGLRRLDVLADGLQEVQVVSVDVSFATNLEWTAQGLVLGNAVYKVPELTLMGRTNTGGGCRPHAATGRLVCLYTSPDGLGGQLAVVDLNSFVIQATTFYDRPDTLGTDTPLLVTGPAGQIALRVRNSTYFNAVGTGVWLVQDASLR
jgi:DNA-binding beta-propeller fold protein YncE